MTNPSFLTTLNISLIDLITSGNNHVERKQNTTSKKLSVNSNSSESPTSILSFGNSSTIVPNPKPQTSNVSLEIIPLEKLKKYAVDLS